MFRFICCLALSNAFTLNTKQIITVGPSCSSYDMLKQLHNNGVNIFRINMSHCKKHEDAQKIIDDIQYINENSEHDSEIMIDLQGPKFRVGNVKGGSCFLKPGSKFTLDDDSEPGDSTRICLPHKELFYCLVKNDRILIDDGLIELKVETTSESEINTVVQTGGMLKGNKGVNLPYVNINWSTLSEKDANDIEFINKNKIDFVAQSFVQSHKEIINLWRKIKYPTKIISKIECPSAVNDLKNIIEFSHGIMIARGDLAVEMGYEKVPVIQKRAIKMAQYYNAEVFVATQMMESMIHNNVPTRAEVSDVANAVIDGATGVMLSAETSIGKHPIECVKVQRKILKEAEEFYYNF